jgi:hypothetical protein
MTKEQPFSTPPWTPALSTCCHHNQSKAPILVGGITIRLGGVWLLAFLAAAKSTLTSLLKPGTQWLVAD